MRIAVVAALVLAACTAQQPAATSAPPSPTQAVVRPSPSPTQAPTPSPLAPSARPIPSGAEPFDLIGLRWADAARLWLIDPRLGRTPELVAKWTPPNEVGSAFSASADRSRVVISAVAPSGASALFVIETRTGAIHSLVEDPAADLLGPVLSARGTTVAYTRRSRGTADARTDGIWSLPIAGGGPSRLVGAGSDGSPQALGWSADGAWLAFTDSGFLHAAAPQLIHVVGADGTRRASTGLSGAAEWYPVSIRLLITTNPPPHDTGLAQVASYDVASRAVGALYRTRAQGAALIAARWKPDGSRFAVIEVEPGAAESVVVVVAPDGAAERPAKASFLYDIFWSVSGDVIALIGGDDSVVRIMNVTSGRTVQLCLRSDDPVRCT